MQISVGAKMRRSGFLCAWDLWCVESFEGESEKLKSSVVLRMDEGIYRFKGKGNDHERKVQLTKLAPNCGCAG